jgi:putative spermidine/putrescine transport system permease protein
LKESGARKRHQAAVDARRLLDIDAPSARRSGAGLATAGFLAPAFIVLTLSFYFPLIMLVSSGGAATGKALQAYAVDPLFWSTVVVTVRISAGTTLFCLLLAIPTAIYAAHAADRVERALIILIAASLFTSILLRTFVWFVLLGRHGLIATVIELAAGPGERQLLFSTPAVIVGMTHILLPTTIIVLWSGMRASARRDYMLYQQFGNSRLLYLSRVCIPLNIRTIGSATLLTFVLSLGFYVTPLLLGGGGGGTTTIGVLIDEQVNRFGSWPNAAALAILLVALIISATAAGWAVVTLLSRALRHTHA